VPVAPFFRYVRALVLGFMKRDSEGVSLTHCSAIAPQLTFKVQGSLSGRRGYRDVGHPRIRNARAI
jgi:hypothetical protein